MKYFLILTFATAVNIVSAQEKVNIDTEIKKLMEKSKLRFYSTEKSLPNNGRLIDLGEFKNFLFSHPPGNDNQSLITFLTPGVYSLSLDNMPCIVPDMSQFNMPTVKKEFNVSGIPNAGEGIIVLPRSGSALVIPYRK